MYSFKKKPPLILRIIGAVIGVVFGTVVVRQFSASRPAVSFEESLVQIGTAANKKLPLMVDEYTRLDATTTGPGREISYKYTLVNHTTNDIGPEALVRLLRPGIVEQFRTNRSMKSLRDGRATVHYQYSDKNGVFLTEITVGPDDLKNDLKK